MTTVAIIQARHTSSRLPGKMNLPLAGIPVIEHIVRRVGDIEEVDRICVTIPEGSAQAPLADVIGSIDGVHISRGPEENLLARFTIAAHETDADVIVRLWGDCPAVDPVLVRHALNAFKREKADWAYLSDKSGWPLGSECQIIKRDTLDTANAEACTATDLEIITPWLDARPEHFRKLSVVRPGATGQSPLEILLDTGADYTKLCKIFDRLYPHNPLFGMNDIERLAADDPALFRAGA